MFNNSSASLPLDLNETLVPEFAGRLLCVLWYLRNQTVPYSQAEEACSMYFDESGRTEMTVFCLVVAVFIIIANTVVLSGIIGNRELHKAYFIYLANLSMADMVAGMALLFYSTAGQMEVTSLYSKMNMKTVMISTQILSASALALQSLNSYVAVRHPIFFHNQAHNAKPIAGFAITTSWLILCLMSLTPSMGWNCLDMPTSNCSSFYHTSQMGITGATMVLLAITALFATTSAFIALKQRPKNRTAGGQPVQGNTLGQRHNPAQNQAGQNQPNNMAQNRAERKYQRSLNKIKTVIAHVVVAFIFWLLPLVLFPICRNRVNCSLPTGPPGIVLIMTFNSAINPIVSIVCTPDLRKGIRKNMTAIYRGLTALVSMIRGNRDNPQDVQQVPPNATYMQGGATRAAEQNTPTDRPATEHSNTRQPGHGIDRTTFTPAKDHLEQ
ncbi:PREDICTED: sphingosine 1-phosphate receptor 5-like [Branchiostoma belcheri]|uniref:Sphingosine 1-phosphate receptor 5-like n=1 Tax=Branchiostoma belcheri TaxID=7741 RepID=A0A6P5AZY1_BRABE|nr:PREDICTED: sphingosine 1-phosphate receptor 5-like [Branchiostoma belcheri]